MKIPRSSTFTSAERQEVLDLYDRLALEDQLRESRRRAIRELELETILDDTPPDRSFLDA